MASTSESLSTAVKLLREKASDTRDAWVQDGIEEREAVLAAERVVDRFTEQLYSSDASVIDLGDDFWDSIAMEFRKAKPLGVVLRRMIEQELSSSGASIVAFATSDQVI